MVTDQALIGEYGVSAKMQLVTQTEIPGCKIGNTSVSETLLLHSHCDQQCDITYIDTPGISNVGDAEGNDITIDAANSAAIMAAIRSCQTLRIVFLINVKDELTQTKAGQIKKLFEVMDRFIKDSSSQMPSVLMLFTHCEGYSHTDVLELLKTLGSQRALGEKLEPFLDHAIALLEVSLSCVSLCCQYMRCMAVGVYRSSLRVLSIPIAATILSS